MTTEQFFDMALHALWAFVGIFSFMFKWMHGRIGKNEDSLNKAKTDIAVLQESHLGSEEVRLIVRDENEKIEAKQDQIQAKQDRMYDLLNELQTTMARSGFVERRDN